MLPDYRPAFFVDEKGNPTGFHVERFSRIMTELGDGYEDIVAPFPVNRLQFSPTGILSAPLTAHTTFTRPKTESSPLADSINLRPTSLKETPDSYSWDLSNEGISPERIVTTVFPRWLLWILSVLLLGLLLSYLFVRALRRQVDSRTRELSDMNTNLENLVNERTRELRDANKLVFQAERAALTSQLVSGVAHQINTPLGIATTAHSYIRNEFQNALSKESAPAGMDLENLDQAFELVENNLEKAADLVKNFRNLSSQNLNTEKTLIQLDEFIPGLMSSLEPEFRKAGCDYSLDLDPVLIEGSLSALSVVLAQLVTNALRHGYRDQSGTVAIRALTRGNRLVLTVEDWGRGIPAQDLKRIMEPFYSTDKFSLRSGLGLNIVENAVNEILGGSMSVSSTVGGSTRFVVSIPNRS